MRINSNSLGSCRSRSVHSYTIRQKKVNIHCNISELQEPTRPLLHNRIRKLDIPSNITYFFGKNLITKIKLLPQLFFGDMAQAEDVRAKGIRRGHVKNADIRMRRYRREAAVKRTAAIGGFMMMAHGRQAVALLMSQAIQAAAAVVHLLLLLLLLLLFQAVATVRVGEEDGGYSGAVE